MTGTKEHRENPLCGTLPDWNVWCIGGAVWIARASPSLVLRAQTDGYKAPAHPARGNGGWPDAIRVFYPPLCFTSIGNSPRSSLNGGNSGVSISVSTTGDISVAWPSLFR